MKTFHSYLQLSTQDKNWLKIVEETEGKITIEMRLRNG